MQALVCCFTASVGIVNTHVNQNFRTIQNFQNSCLKGQLYVLVDTTCGELQQKINIASSNTMFIVTIYF